jgi:hypothetical protein
MLNRKLHKLIVDLTYIPWVWAFIFISRSSSSRDKEPQASLNLQTSSNLQLHYHNNQVNNNLCQKIMLMIQSRKGSIIDTITWLSQHKVRLKEELKGREWKGLFTPTFYCE